jgi:hypothetical protein
MYDQHLALYMFLYVYVAICVISILAMRLPNPGLLQDAAGNQDAHGGHEIGDVRLIGCVSY